MMIHTGALIALPLGDAGDHQVSDLGVHPESLNQLLKDTQCPTLCRSSRISPHPKAHV
jgi:hypothetical protein